MARHHEITSAIPVDDIVPGATIRMTVMDGVQYLSVRDVIMHVSNCSAKTANKTWERLADSRKEEVATKCRNFKFSGQGQSEQPVITFKGVLKLIMWIGGENAKKYRSSMVSILQRYYAGDDSLLDEVHANAESDAPIQQMARASLAAEAPAPAAVEPVQDVQALARKRKLEELEISKLELDITIKRREAEFEHASKIASTYRDLCQDTVMDNRARLMFKDYFLNMIMPQNQPPPPAMLTDGGSQQQQPSQSPSKPISLSQVAVQMGLKISTPELISLGGKLRKRYEERHGHPPSKHDQLCDGRMTKVNSYSESDRPLVEEVLREWQKNE